MEQPKILILDIETAPTLGYVWGMFDQNLSPSQVVQEGYVLCWSAKWLGNKEVMFDSIFNYRKNFKNNPTDDSLVAKTIWKLLDEADIVVAHNGDNFDLKWLNTIFLKNHLPPVSSYKSIDTLKEAKNNFRFLSNKLEHLVKSLGVGEKMKNEGFSLWPKCMSGDPVAWKQMELYNKRDIIILENLYLGMKPFMKHHPKFGLFVNEELQICNICGSKNLKKKGFAYTSINKYQRFICDDCGASSRSRSSVLSKDKRQSINNNC